MVPLALESDIVRLSNTLKDYNSVKVYVHEQVAVRRDMKAQCSGPVPMEVDMMKKVIQTLVTGEDAGDEQGQDEGEQGGYEGCVPCGEHQHEEQHDDHKNGETGDMMKDLLSFVRGIKGDKGKGKGGKSPGKGQRFDGTCSHCGVYGHRLRECWKKDKEMQEWRGQKGKGKGKGEDGGKGGWQQGYWSQKGKGKGKGQQYNLDWGNGYGAASQASQKAWSLNLMKKIKPAEKPPGLESYFEVLRLQDVQAEEDLKQLNDEDEYPDMRVAENKAENINRKKMPKMPNYSKNKVAKEKREKTEKDIDKVHKENIQGMRQMKKACYLFEKMPMQKGLNKFVGAKPDAEGWVKVESVMDSGASECVAPPDMCPDYEIVPSVGSEMGQKYVSASDDEIPNLGEKHLDIVTMQGKETKGLYQIADVARPLNAVSEICDAGGDLGQHVVFGKNGGAIINLNTGAQTPFGRKDGIYVMEFWVKPKGMSRSGQGFPRQG